MIWADEILVHRGSSCEQEPTVDALAQGAKVVAALLTLCRLGN